MSVPLSRMRPRVGSWKRATRSVTVVFPAPLRPTNATTEPPGTATLKSRTTGCPARYSKATSSNRSSRTSAGAGRASGRSGLSSSIASTSNTRSIAANDVQVAAEPHDDHADARLQQPPRRPQQQLAPVGEQLFAQHRVAAEHVAEQLLDLLAERPHHPDARERLADAAVDHLHILPHGAVDGANAPHENETQHHHARNDRHGRQRELP